MKIDRSLVTRLLVPFAVGVAVAGGAIAVTAYAAGVRLVPAAAAKPAVAPAQAPAAANSALSYCQDFVSHFAADLKTSSSKVDSAADQAFQQTLADAVQRGDLTQAQADAIAQKATGQAACANALSGIGKQAAGKPGAGAANAALAKVMQAYLAAAASALGMQPADVAAALKSGTSLSELAQQKGVSESDFRSKLIAALQPQLDQAVSQGQLTKEQESEILQRLQTGPLPDWAKAAKPKASPSPQA
jgi:uncharacterized protein YidB (DUF937 family)